MSVGTGTGASARSVTCRGARSRGPSFGKLASVHDECALPWLRLLEVLPVPLLFAGPQAAVHFEAYAWDANPVASLRHDALE